MPRTARKISESGIYHIIMRGINRQIIFLDDEDSEQFLDTLISFKENGGFKVFGYCLMGNHIHLLLKEEKESISEVMRKISSSFVYWYNFKYNRVGNLFQDRFKSEPVESDEYLSEVIRYIHQNPVKAHISKKMEDYVWSSYKDYIKNDTRIINSVNILELFNKGNKEKALEEFKTFHEEESDINCLDIEPLKIRISDKEIIEIINKKYKIRAMDIQKIEREEMKNILREILKTTKISTRQLSRVTGVSTHIIWTM